MRINTNVTALNTFNSYTAANNKIAGSVAKLSSGYAINSAADNAAGLAISEKMRAQIRGLDKAASNGQDAISLVQTAEGALGSADKILQRMREISVQSSSDTNEDAIDRDALQAEFAQLQDELDNISEDTTFNNQKLLDGSLSTTQKSIGSGTALNGSGMNASVGNADAGTYGFSVEVVTTQAAIAAAAPTSAASSFATSSLSSEFSTATVAVGTNADKSALLNGNYSLSASYDQASEKVTVTATGDNGQTFSTTLSATDLANKTAGSTIALNFESSTGADDTFSVTLKAGETLTSLTATTSELDTLAKTIGGSFTVAGGKNAVEEEKAVMANLTGAESVELKSGMDSVTFDNGVTVSFEKLTAADLDTTADRKLSTALTLNADSYDNTASSVNFAATSNIGVYAISQNYTFSSETNTDGTVTVTATGTERGDVFTATTAQASFDIADGPQNLDFKDTAGNIGFRSTFTATANGTTASTIGTDFGNSSFSLNANAAADLQIGYNFESVFGATSADATTNDDTGVSQSTVEVTSKSNDGLTIQVGANSGDELSINIDCASAQHLGVRGLDVSTQEGAAKAINSVNDAINNVSSQRAYLGAVQNRLDYKISNLETSSQNLTSAESSIRDVDMAKEMTKFTNANILSQASTAMLAQANSLPQNVLSLLG